MVDAGILERLRLGFLELDLPSVFRFDFLSECCEPLGEADDFSDLNLISGSPLDFFGVIVSESQLMAA